MRVLVVLDPQGKPTSCTVNSTSDDDALDAASCKLARQARYTPGKDVYLEKPVSHDVDEGIRLLAVQQRTGRIVAAGTQIVTAAQYSGPIVIAHDGWRTNFGD